MQNYKRQRDRNKRKDNRLRREIKDIYQQLLVIPEKVNQNGRNKIIKELVYKKKINPEQQNINFQLERAYKLPDLN